jgi:hypothetical protein
VKKLLNFKMRVKMTVERSQVCDLEKSKAIPLQAWTGP